MMTLKKISHLSGYSVSTVSKALNNGGDINADTKKLIKKLALQYNYTPNRNAVALRRKQSFMLAIIMPQVNEQPFADLLFLIQQKTVQHNYRLLVYQSFYDQDLENGFLEEINDGSVAGVLVISNFLSSGSVAQLPLARIKCTQQGQSKFDLERAMEKFDQLLQQINF